MGIRGHIWKMSTACSGFLKPNFCHFFAGCNTEHFYCHLLFFFSFFFFSVFSTGDNLAGMIWEYTTDKSGRVTKQKTFYLENEDGD